MLLRTINNQRLNFLLGVALVFLPTMLSAAGTQNEKTNTWTLASPDGRCAISVFLGEEGALSYQVQFEEKEVIGKSPLGLRRDDQDFTHGLTFERAGKIEHRREKYELFAAGNPQVDHVLNHRSLVFRNANHAAMEIELAAGGEGVAFRYLFTEKARDVHVMQAESTGFAISPEARGWLQPYHAAGPYTPAYEDFYFHV